MLFVTKVTFMFVHNSSITGGKGIAQYGNDEKEGYETNGRGRAKLKKDGVDKQSRKAGFG